MSMAKCWREVLAIMKFYDTLLIKRQQVAEQAYQFFLKKPPGFKYRAGDSLEVILSAPHDGAGATPQARGFALASAPHEPLLALTTRLHSNAVFSQALARLPHGCSVKITESSAGLGRVRDDGSVPAVFLTGGTGIAPARAMIAQAIHEGSPRSLTLIASNVNLQRALFVDELRAFCKKNPRFYFVEAYDEYAADDVSVERGPITPTMILRQVPDYLTSEYYLSGPPGMGDRLSAVLLAMGVPEARIRILDTRQR